MAEGDNRSTNQLVSPGAATQGKGVRPLYCVRLKAAAPRPWPSPGFQAQAATPALSGFLGSFCVAVASRIVP